MLFLLVLRLRLTAFSSVGAGTGPDFAVGLAEGGGHSFLLSI